MIKRLYKKLIPESTRLQLRINLQKLFASFYTGNQYYCNCCHKSFRKFLSKGNIPRKNAKCPFCSSLERTRVLDLYLEKELELYKKENFSLLHFAPEEGLFRKLSKLKRVEYIDGDINPAYARSSIDITNIKYPTDHFDYIICSHVLGHVPDEPKAIKEMYRVLKKGGIALVMTLLSGNKDTFENNTIIRPEDRLKHFGEPDLYRLHGFDLVERLQKHGFSTKIIDYREHFSREMQEKYSLGDGKREIIFKCVKQ